MTLPTDANQTAGGLPRRLCYFNAGFLRQKRLRRILQLAGHELVPLRATGADGVLVWGRSPYAIRGEAVAEARGLPILRVEDAFLRSIHPGRSGAPPIGLMLDATGVHFDAASPSRLEGILARDPLSDSDLLRRARDGIGRIRALHLSKYNAHDPDLAPPPAGYVLVIDQTRGDAAIHHGGATAASFAEMLLAAKLDHPTARILIKTHPETQAGHRPGHFGAADCDARVSLYADPVSPQALLEGAIAVYTVTSQLGFEAILAGHRPHVFGQPFYAGWGLTHDRQPLPRRGRKLTPAQVFAGAIILAPIWYDPCRDRLCSFEAALDQLEAETRAFREDRRGHVASGMRLWKRAPLQAFFGREARLRFVDPVPKAALRAERMRRPLLIWAGKEPPDFAPPVPVRRVEDGFLRSRGLGADLVPPLSLVTDDLGIYYDPSRESRLERLIRAPLSVAAARRVEVLLEKLLAARLSKYNLAAATPDLPDAQGRRIVLVPGQVEDDASIRLGCGEIRSNLALLQAARAANPDAMILYKPHPDVEAGLRPGAVAAAEMIGLADFIAPHSDPITLIGFADEVWTMTSLLGFEALLRGKPVTCLGAPFYAGWGLTTDLGPVPERRRRAPDGHPLPHVTLHQLAHAALIAYPRYHDPVSGLPCPAEVAIDRLASGQIPPARLANRLLAKAQGLLASQSWLWRR
ncbi:capsular polysaccharide biosynthesis protein [Gemmobacter serpentinus]|uniref:capsular polysaccharide biosynthesis protein n=1 Tax=Gemmobacter serpentinus TaxID=2652247 RepID=UPI00124C2CCD|nr:capsular polysaccharide biosynthesis protein [Gemmobacter serpentinus]